MTDTHRALARQLAELFGQLPQVEAVAVAGSLTSGAGTDKSTDIDLYVYTTALVPLEARLAMVEERRRRITRGHEPGLLGPGG